jgi:hypothetical protein
MALPYLACMMMAANYYHLPPRVLPSIHAVEGGYAGAVIPDSNGTADLGVMQINTTWIQPLSRYAHMQPAAVAGRLIHDPCFNVAAAGLILYSYITQRHESLMDAVGHYHSHTPLLKMTYEAKVVQAAETLFR